jgi:hypothetical protein
MQKPNRSFCFETNKFFKFIIWIIYKCRNEFYKIKNSIEIYISLKIYFLFTSFLEICIVSE